MTVSIAYEDENYRVVRAASRVGSAVSIVTFDHWMSTRQPLVPDAFADIKAWNFATKIGYNLIHVQTRRNDWYQLDGIDEALRAAAEFKRGGDFFVSYGASMGGYSAAAFADDVRADLFIAFSPQASISEAYMSEIGDRRWSTSRPLFTRETIIGRPRKSCPGVIVYDPAHKQDAQHAHTIGRHSNAHFLTIPGGWHHPRTAISKEMGWQIFADWLIHAARNEGGVTNATEDLQALVDRTLLARFATGPSDVRMEILTREGVEVIRSLISLDYLCHELSETPDAVAAAILYELAVGSSEPSEIERAAATLAKCGFVDFAGELTRRSASLS